MPEYNIEIDYEAIFNKRYLPYLSKAYDTEIFYGGSSSGKSHFVAHRTILDILNGGHNYLCVRKVSNSVMKSVMNELSKAIADFQVGPLFKIVPSQSLITCVNGYQILLTGLDDPEKVKSITPAKGVITDVWYEEATEGSPDDIKQLRKRLRGITPGFEITKRIIMTFNPIYQSHWLYGDFFTKWRDGDTEFISKHPNPKSKAKKPPMIPDGKLSICKSTHLDNDFLTDQDHALLESEPDPYWYSVYTLGDWGSLGDAILTNWRTEDLSKKSRDFDNIRNGLDFGYADSPTSFVRIHYDGDRKKIYIFNGFEERGLTNFSLAAKLQPIIGGEPIFCDSAEPKSVEELKELGIYAIGAKKGPGSRLHGIQWLQQHEIIIDSSLQHIINEATVWSWKKDKDGNSLPIPEKKNDHSWDATRYGLEVEFGGFFGGLL